MQSEDAIRRNSRWAVSLVIFIGILVVLADNFAIINITNNAGYTKAEQAKADMRAIEKAYRLYYQKHQNWPQDIGQVAPLLEQGDQALLDPWGNRYQVQVNRIPGEGAPNEGPLFTCKPPGGKTPIHYP